MGDTATCHDDQNEKQATGIGSGRWYRFDGDGGDALPLTSPGQNHCGTSYTGWLSGWTEVGAPLGSFNERGRYPTVAEGVVEMTVCFDYASGGGPCHGHTTVGVVHCGDFLLWRLVDTAAADQRVNPNSAGIGGAGCDHAYCTTLSGMQPHGG
eukprot:SAG22_NODE_6662_length_825_cov_2.140496_1_plen_153_part_00